MSSLAKLKWYHLLAFLFPAAFLYVAFLVGPMFHSLLRSLYDNHGVFVGAHNYADLLGGGENTERFWSAAIHNLQFLAIHMVFQNGIGLTLAALLTRRNLRGTHLFRTVLFLPALLSPVIVGFIWKLILSPIWNVRATILAPLGLESISRTPLLNQSGTVLNTISLISVWEFTGIAMILFYAALLRIPDSLIEAATVDGAGAWDVFWKVKLPLIKPTIGVVAILTFLGNMNAFDLVFTMKGADAGPNFASDLLGTLFYRTSFGQNSFGDLAAGTTVGGATFWIILAGSLLYYIFWANRVESYDF